MMMIAFITIKCCEPIFQAPKVTLLYAQSFLDCRYHVHIHTKHWVGRVNLEHLPNMTRSDVATQRVFYTDECHDRAIKREIEKLK